MKPTHFPTSQTRSWTPILGTLFAAASVQAATLPISVLMVGDSITNGQGAGAELSYPEQLAEWLGDDYEVIEEGCGGSKSFDWRPSSIFFYAPTGACEGGTFWLYFNHINNHLPVDILTILLGTNDGISVTNADPPFFTDLLFENSIRQVASEALANGVAKVILMTPPKLPLNFGADNHAYIEAYGERIFDICDSMDNVICGPDLWALLDREQHFDLLPDATVRDLHPNPAGHELVAVELFDAIVSVPEPQPEWMLAWGTAALSLMVRARRCQSETRVASLP